MNSYVQFISLLSSFIYGVVLFYLNNLNTRLIKNKNILSKIIISCLYVFNVYGTTKMKQDYQRLDVGSATAYAKYLGKHQLNNDIKSGNKTSRYIYKY